VPLAACLSPCIALEEALDVVVLHLADIEHLPAPDMHPGEEVVNGLGHQRAVLEEGPQLHLPEDGRGGGGGSRPRIAEDIHHLIAPGPLPRNRERRRDVLRHRRLWPPYRTASRKR
jgi:hypothetical protein